MDNEATMLFDMINGTKFAHLYTYICARFSLQTRANEALFNFALFAGILLLLFTCLYYGHWRRGFSLMECTYHLVNSL